VDIPDDQKSPTLGLSWPGLLAGATIFTPKRLRCTELAFRSGIALGYSYPGQQIFIFWWSQFLAVQVRN
jgi:hypothetical protein